MNNPYFLSADKEAAKEEHTADDDTFQETPISKNHRDSYQTINSDDEIVFGEEDASHQEHGSEKNKEEDATPGDKNTATHPSKEANAWVETMKAASDIRC